LNWRAAVLDPLVTLTVKRNCPVAAGVPTSAPDDPSSVTPGGRYENGATVHVGVPVPPLAVNVVVVYGVPTLPAVRVEFPLIEIGVTFSVNCRTPKFVPFLASTRNV
jgi:hypothetical protein